MLNGHPTEIRDGATVADLIEQQGLTGRRLAVERNREIVPRSQHATTCLQAGDIIEIVHAIGGG
jgi:sulfur carrier protein